MRSNEIQQIAFIQYFWLEEVSERTSHVDRLQMVLEDPISLILPRIDPQEENDSDFLNNTDNIKTQWFWNIFYVSLILISYFLFTFPVLLIPQHNTIQFQEYWYESTVLGIFTIILTGAIDTLIIIKYYFKVDSYTYIKIFVQVYFFMVILWAGINVLCHYVWTVAIGYQHPIPLTLVFGYFVFAMKDLIVYINFSQYDSWESHFSMRFKNMLKSRLWCIAIDLQYKGLSLLFNMLPSEIQWILAFILPLIREVNYTILVYIMYKGPKITDSGEENSVIAMYGFSALYLAILLGQTTTDMTTILILVVDFSMN